jgi:hypothetical protein
MGIMGVRFQFNPDIDRPLSDLLRWKWQALRNGLPRPAPYERQWRRL